MADTREKDLVEKETALTLEIERLLHRTSLAAVVKALTWRSSIRIRSRPTTRTTNTPSLGKL
jgi:hypothetical protein